MPTSSRHNTVHNIILVYARSARDTSLVTLRIFPAFRRLVLRTRSALADENARVRWVRPPIWSAKRKRNRANKCSPDFLLVERVSSYLGLSFLLEKHLLQQCNIFSRKFTTSANNTVCPSQVPAVKLNSQTKTRLFWACNLSNLHRFGGRT